MANTRAGTTAQPGEIYWTLFQPLVGDERPIDPLGFGMYAERLGNLILPGLTGRTTRVRYLGMVCAGLAQTVDQAAELPGRPRQTRRQAFRPFERAWALAVCHAAEMHEGLKGMGGPRPALRPEYQGFRGANNVLGYYREEYKAGRSRVDATGYKLLEGQTAQGGLGSYLVLLARAGFVDGRTLSLREVGRELADAFIADQRRRMKWFRDGANPTWDMLYELGRSFDLARPSDEESSIVRREVFDQRTGYLATAVQGLGTNARSEEAALHRLSQSSNEFADVAAYILAFEPIRKSALATFGQLGDALTAEGEIASRALPPDVLDAAERTSADAARLMEFDPPPAAVEVHEFARRLTVTTNPVASIDEILAWHHQHRSPWILRDGARYVLGRPGNFEEPDQFHGYTVGSYLSLLHDLVAGEPA